MPTDDPTLACLEQFFRDAMPAAMRKLRAWQGLNVNRHGDLIADLVQDVAADFVAHRAAIEAMTKDERHERWLRLVGRSHYRLRGRRARVFDDNANFDEMAAAVSAAMQPPALDGSSAAFVEKVLQHGVHLKNGRLNECITARSIGLTPLQFRRRGELLVQALQGERETEFWRRRLVEALVGLAADVLRDSGHLVIHGEQGRSRPDPAARLRRVRRIRARLRHLPVGTPLRRVLQRYGSKGRDPYDPERALDSARELAPCAPSIHLWAFESAVARGDARAAALHVRRARLWCADQTPVVLARARLLELRGQEPAARALLRRACRRRDDPRLRLCLERLCDLVKASG